MRAWAFLGEVGLGREIGGLGGSVDGGQEKRLSMNLRWSGI